MDSPPCVRWQRRPTERRAEILAAARVVFGEAGFAKATLGDVAERAGVSAATVSHYFGSKAGLFEAMVAEEAFELAETPPVVVEDGRYLDALHQLLEAKWAKLTRPGMPEMTLTVLSEMRDFPQSARSLFRQLSERSRARIEHLLGAGQAAGAFNVGDPRLTAQVIDALFLGAVLQMHFVAGCTDSPPCCIGALPRLLLAIDQLLGLPTAPRDHSSDSTDC
ncbi:MAG: TetR/AcrR family transcriptional regulator [Gemmatimonadales bacterium]